MSGLLRGETSPLRRYVHSTAKRVRQVAGTTTDDSPGKEHGEGEVLHLISMASFPNYGDEIIARAWLRFLARVKPGAQVHLDCRNPALATVLFEGDHPRLRTTDTIFRLIEQAGREGEERSITELIENFGTPAYDLQVEQLREATTLHMLGGGYINTLWPQYLGILEAMRAVHHLTGARLLATGQGLMPWVNPSFADFAHVSVRDDPSAKALGCARGVDDAFLAAPDAIPATAPAEEIIVCIQNDAISPGAFDQFVSTAASLLHQGGWRDLSVTYLEAIPGFDHGGYAALREAGVRVDRFLPFAQAWRHGFRFGPQHRVVSTRFHHHLLGALGGAQGVALVERGEYYSTKHASLRDMGTGWELLTEPTELSLDALRAPTGERLVRARRHKVEEATRLYS